MSRLMKTLARQGSRYQAKETWQNRNKLGMTWDEAAERAAQHTLLVVTLAHLSMSHKHATKRRARVATLRFTGWKPCIYSWHFVKRI